MKLSVMIPTRGRQKSFESAFEKAKEFASAHDDVQIVVACQTKEYMPVCADSNILILDTSDTKHEKNARELNYIKGVDSCTGKYILIHEDDDFINYDALEFFLNQNFTEPIVVFDIANMNMKIGFSSMKQTKDVFISGFPDIFKEKFQWGQCVFLRNMLYASMLDVWDSIVPGFAQSDELITLHMASMMRDKKRAVAAFVDQPLLFVGVHDDNFSWNTGIENEQKYMYMAYLKRFVSNDTNFLRKMEGIEY